MEIVGGTESGKLAVAVLKRISYGANIVLPEMALTAVFVTRTVTSVSPGSPAPLAMKVIVSPAGDQPKVPPMAGEVEKAAWTLFVSIGSLN